MPPENNQMRPYGPANPNPGTPVYTPGELPAPVSSYHSPSPQSPTDQRVTKQGNVEIQHAPGYAPQSDHPTAAQPLKPLQAGPAAPTEQAYPPGQAAEAPDNPYAFFLDTKAKPTKSERIKGASKFTKIIALAAGLVVLLIIAAVVLTTLRSKPQDATTGTLTSVLRQQQEIIRVNGLATKNVQSTNLQNFVVTANSVLTTEQQKTLAYVKKNGGDVDEKLLASSKGDATTDTALSTAQSANTYDSTFSRIIADLLTAYRTNLAVLYKSATGPKQRQLLEDNFNAAELLDKMLLAK